MLKRICKFGKETDYLVSDKGEIWSEKTKKFLKGDTNSGYHRVLLIIIGYFADISVANLQKKIIKIHFRFRDYPKGVRY